jgi:hypothetical protein
MQDSKMENIFYYNWLSIGDSENVYSEKYNIVKFQEGDSFSETEDAKISEGFVCRFANRLRNNNCYLRIGIKPNQEVTLNQISDILSRTVYCWSGNLLAEHHGCWVLYNSESLKNIEQGNWSNNGSSFYCYEEGFQFFDKVLKRLSKEGKPLNNFHLFGGSDLDHHDIIYFNDNIISAGYLSPNAFSGDGLPGILKPAGQLESFNLKKNNIKPEPNENLSPEFSNLLAFLQEKPLIPIYLDNFIIQPLNNRIAIINYDLKLNKVIEGEFVPLSASAGKNSIIYMVAVEDENKKLFAFDIEGNLFFNKKIENNVGDKICPPAISSDGNIYIIATNAVTAFKKNGDIIWIRYFNNSSSKEVYPLLYNDILTITYDNTILVFNPEGEIILNKADIKGTINTPLVSIDGRKHFIGTDKGLFEVVIK